jgi:hypothetical protein
VLLRIVFIVVYQNVAVVLGVAEEIAIPVQKKLDAHRRAIPANQLAHLPERVGLELAKGAHGAGLWWAGRVALRGRPIGEGSLGHRKILFVILFTIIV